MIPLMLHRFAPCRTGIYRFLKSLRPALSKNGNDKRLLMHYCYSVSGRTCHLPKLHSRCAAFGACRPERYSKGELAMLSSTWKGARLGAIMAAATSIAVPIAAHAQDQMPLGYPVVGPYVGVMGGFNIKANPSVKNLSSNLNPFSNGLSTPNLNISTNIGGAAIGAFGWGF